MATINAKICIRRDTAANWTANNPTLLVGEVGFETDTGKMKVGSGVGWTSTAYTNTMTTTLAITSAADAVQGVYPHPTTEIEPDIEYSSGALEVLGGISVQGESWFGKDITIALEPQTPGFVAQPFRIGTGRGTNAGLRNTNTVVGSSILDANTTGAYNTGVGVDVLSCNTTGSGNTAVGHDAMVTNRTGSNNSAFGYGSLGGENLSFSTQNTGLGRNALATGVLGLGNTGAGSGAGANLSCVEIISVSTSTNRLSVGSGHGFVVNQEIRLQTTGTLPEPLQAATTYYVRQALSTAITLSTTVGGSEIDITTTGSGTHYIVNAAETNVFLGYNAGVSKADNQPLQSARNCLYIGAQTKASKNNNVNEIVIGGGAVGKGSNTVLIGTPDTNKTYIDGSLNLSRGTLELIPESGAEVVRFYMDDGFSGESFTLTADPNEGIFEGYATASFEWVLEGPVTLGDGVVIRASPVPPSVPANAWRLWNDAGTLKAINSNGIVRTLAAP